MITTATSPKIPTIPTIIRSIMFSGLCITDLLRNRVKKGIARLQTHHPNSPALIDAKPTYRLSSDLFHRLSASRSLTFSGLFSCLCSNIQNNAFFTKHATSSLFRQRFCLMFCRKFGHDLSVYRSINRHKYSRSNRIYLGNFDSNLSQLPCNRLLLLRTSSTLSF